MLLTTNLNAKSLRNQGVTKSSTIKQSRAIKGSGLGAIKRAIKGSGLASNQGVQSRVQSRGQVLNYELSARFKLPSGVSISKW